ncbi:MAG TPA: CsbD family protein [Bradyrhizobium sp.]
MDKDRIFGTAKEFVGKAEGAVGDATGDAQTQASGRAREAAGAVQDLYGQAKDAARDAADTAVNFAKDTFKDAYEHRGETVRSGQKAMAQTVQDNPLGSLLIAGGIGFALALLMTRQPRRPPSRWRYYG